VPGFCGAARVSRAVWDCLTTRSKSTKVFVSLAFRPCPIQPRPIVNMCFSGIQKDSRVPDPSACVFTLKTGMRALDCCSARLLEDECNPCQRRFSNCSTALWG